jgi:hypothetical protein
VCGMLMRGPPPGSTTTPPAIFTAVASSTPAVLELSAFELEASAGAPISSSGTLLRFELCGRSIEPSRTTGLDARHPTEGVGPLSS